MQLVIEQLPFRGCPEELAPSLKAIQSFEQLGSSSLPKLLSDNTTSSIIVLYCDTQCTIDFNSLTSCSTTKPYYICTDIYIAQSIGSLSIVLATPLACTPSGGIQQGVDSEQGNIVTGPNNGNGDLYSKFQYFHQHLYTHVAK